ncbi:hypothetical protein GGQ92_001542 [Gracilibacillus halotolerans]|uniref:DUF1189 domain-containing protein n=1 Tax=Gracilibacillus halotolerans TaxID=74386 RepID=A0A841RMU2_9BACI|nr:hypothetical protein [Gracilibacillus halotolerans]MBB6512756.1 hypothetical protein [Gracilibacillus halotolerans]
MSLLKIIKLSSKLPNKKAVFALNRVAMRDTLVYLFCLFFFLFLPYTFLNMMDVYENAISKSQLVLQSIIFYPFFMMFLVIVSISTLAAIATIFRFILSRKLAYQQLWKMSAYAILWPFILYQITLFLPISNYVGLAVSFGIYVYLMWRMILIYPRRKKK